MYYFNYLCKFNENKTYHNFVNKTCDFLVNYYKNKSTKECINIIKKLIKDLSGYKYESYPTTNSPDYYGIPPEMLPLYFFEIVFEELLSRDIDEKTKYNIMYLKYRLYFISFYHDELYLYNLEYDKNLFKDLLYKLYYFNKPQINKQIYDLFLCHSHLASYILCLVNIKVNKVKVDFFIKKELYLKNILKYIFPSEYNEILFNAQNNLKSYLEDLTSKYKIEELYFRKNIKYLELIIVLYDMLVYEEESYPNYTKHLSKEIYEFKNYSELEEYKYNYFKECRNELLNKLSIYLKIFSEHKIRDLQFTYYYTIEKAKIFKELLFLDSTWKTYSTFFYINDEYSNIPYHIDNYKYITETNPETMVEEIDLLLKFEHVGSYFNDYQYWAEPLKGSPYSLAKEEEERMNALDEIRLREEEYMRRRKFEEFEENEYLNEAFGGDCEEFENYIDGIID